MQGRSNCLVADFIDSAKIKSTQHFGNIVRLLKPDAPLINDSPIHFNQNASPSDHEPEEVKASELAAAQIEDNTDVAQPSQQEEANEPQKPAKTKKEKKK